MRTLTYYVATTLDGFIADPSGGFDFFPVPDELVSVLVEEFPETIPTQARAHLGIDPPNKNFDAVVMGRRTWEPSLDDGVTSSYQHLKQYVFSTTMSEAPDDTVTLVDSDPLAYVRELKQQDGGGIWLCGGGSLAGALLPEIDELVDQFVEFGVGMSGQFPAFDRDLGIELFVLCGHRGVLTQGHRECAGRQTRDAAEDDGVTGGAGGADTGDQADIRDQSVHRAEGRSAEPSARDIGTGVTRLVSPGPGRMRCLVRIFVGRHLAIVRPATGGSAQIVLRRRSIPW